MSRAASARTAVVTGANAGLGFETSAALAAAGLYVILGCRDARKGQSALERIRLRTPDANVECLPLDLVDRQSVRQFAKAVTDRMPALDLLINNAGVFCPPYTITDNGLELQLDANHVGPFLLTSRLIGALDQPRETRIVNVSSVAARSRRARIQFDNLNFENCYDTDGRFMGRAGMTAYAQSKLANLLFTLALHDRLVHAEKKIKAVVAHPGVSQTQIVRHLPFVVPLLMTLVRPLLPISTAAEGAKSIVFAARDASVKSGEYIGPTGPRQHTGAPGRVPIPENARDVALRNRLWSVSETLIGQPFGL